MRLGETTAPVTAAAPTSWGEKLASTIQSVASAVIPVWQQTRMQKLQESRLKKGLEPIDPALLATQVRVGSSPEVEKALSGTMNAAKVAMIAVPLGLLAMMLLKGRR